MLVTRRALAILSIAALIPLLAGVLLLLRVNSTLLNPDYVKDELRRLDSYAFVEQELYVSLIDEALNDNATLLPPGLEGVELPNDDAARQSLLRLLQTAFPQSYLQQQSEALLDELVPYLTGATDDFALAPAFNDRLLAVAGHAPGEPSELERTFRELDLAPLFIDHLVASTLAEDGQEGPPPGPLGSIADRADAAEWFTTELFTAVDAVVPYLLGDADTFEVRISFAGREHLALPFAGLLGKTPEELIRDGYLVTDADLQDRLGGPDSAAFDDLDGNLEVLRTGWTLGPIDLFDDADELAEVDDLRSLAGGARGIVRLGGIAAVLGLLFGIAMLGGRSWRGRLAWAAAGLFIAAFTVLMVAGPLYDGLAAGRIHDALLSASDDWTGVFGTHRDTIIADVEGVADRFVAGIAQSALLITLASGATLAGLFAWGRYRRGASHDADPAQPSLPRQQAERRAA